MAVAIAFSAIFLSANAALGCRYNIRDIGFVDLGQRNLVIEVESPSLQQANEAAERIRTRLRTEHLQLPVRNVVSKDSSHRCTLRSEDRSLTLFADTDASFLVDRSVEAILPPTNQEQWQQSLIDHSCLVLLLLTGDRTRDEKARTIVSHGIKLSIDEADLWEKPMTGHPQLLEITPEEKAEVKTVLWSLGFPDDSGLPMAAVLYGRLRRIGPLLFEDELSAARVSSIISLLGRDCECELPREIFFGPSPPQRWSVKIAEQARRALDFDPEHPMVEMEVRQIVSRDHPSVMQQSLDDSEMFLGYEEIELDSLLPHAPAASGAADQSGKPSFSKSATQASIHETATSQPRQSLPLVIATVVGLASCSAVVGWWLSRSK